MSKKLFGKDIEPKCAYCVRCVLTEDKKTALCEKRGFTSLDDACKKFVYDPTKRVPRPSAPPIPEFEAVDFSLDLEEDE